ncbi:MAG: cysteine desulfurase [Anaerolineae bacterium]|nr:cysteine desulfurase [Anaerolineae bacterium]
MGTQQVIYLDHAATTAVDARVLAAMLPFWTERYGNASSLHRLGRDAAHALDEARRSVAQVLACKPGEIVFTGCGSESDNLAVRGVAMAQQARGRGRHIVASAVEHHAVGHTVQELVEHYDFEATFVGVDRTGRVNPDDVARALRSDTVLVSIMYANNEVGTIQPLAEIGRICRAREIPFHTDAVQAGGWLPLDVDALQVDLLSLGAHKFCGPKGVGALYLRQGTPLWPVQTGGGHEGGRRAGTENVPYIVGLATALRLAHEEREAENRRIAAMRDRLIAGVLACVSDTYLTGHPAERLPNSASFVIRGVEVEGILIGLDLEGICASSGSACNSASAKPSHVLTAMGLTSPDVYGHLRLTLGHENTDADVDRLLSALPGMVARLRAHAPMAAFKQ